MKFDDEIKELVKVAAKLNDNTSVQRRRALRRAIMDRLKRVREALDDTYPHLRSAPEKRRLLGRTQRHRQLVGAGYVEVRLTELKMFAMEIGAAVRPDPYHASRTGTVYIASWIRDAWNAGVSVNYARKMLRSMPTRQAFLTQNLLAKNLPYSP